MKNKHVIIITIFLILFLLLAVVTPTIKYKGWANNEHYYYTWGYDGDDDYAMICDEWLWNPPQNCQFFYLGEITCGDYNDIKIRAECFENRPTILIDDITVGEFVSLMIPVISMLIWIAIIIIWKLRKNKT